MDVDVSIFQKDFSSEVLHQLIDLGAREVDGYLQVSRSFSEPDDLAESRIMGFIEELESSAPGMFGPESVLEIAYYYDAKLKAHFGTTLSATFTAFTASRNLQLKLIGYPCVDDETSI